MCEPLRFLQRLAPPVCLSPEVGDAEVEQDQDRHEWADDREHDASRDHGSCGTLRRIEDLVEVRCLSRARVDRVAETLLPPAPAGGVM
jgi:hypothetical protein